MTTPLIIAPAARPPRLGLIAGLIIGLAEIAALVIDDKVLLRRCHAGASLVPGDLLAFRDYALALLHSGRAAGSAGYLPYPLPFFLFAAPLTWTSPEIGYAVWLLAGNLALAAAGRRAGLSWAAIGLGLLSPANLYCMAMGQTGELVSAFLLLALSLQNRRALPGIAAALVVIKPQFGLLLPICFLAARRYKLIGIAALGVACLGLFSLSLVTLPDARSLAAHETQGAAWMANAAWPQPYQYAMVTTFILLRSLGAVPVWAYAGQALVTCGAMLACWRLWRAPARAPLARLAATLCLVALAAPYAYLYDLPAIGLALAATGLSGPPRRVAGLALFWLLTGLYGVISLIWLPLGCAGLALVTWLIWPAPASSASNSATCS